MARQAQRWKAWWSPKRLTAAEGLGQCQSGALCGRPADGLLKLRILGDTPFCSQCAERYLNVKKRVKDDHDRQHTAGIVDEWENWLQQRSQKGQLGVGGDKDLYDFASDMGIGDRGIDHLRRYLFGSRQVEAEIQKNWYQNLVEERKKQIKRERNKKDLPYTGGPYYQKKPKAKAASRKEAWTGWGPVEAARQHKVDGWAWDKRLSAYVATKQPESFTCKCGAKHKVPSYTNCKCGKIWNSYVIGTGGENRQATVEKFLCREVPVRDNVIVAGRKVASGKARYILLPHWDADEAYRILMQHAQDMGTHTALQVSPELMDMAHKGGFTLHDHIGDAPTDGYMVSLDKNTEHSMPITDLRPQHIQAFADKHANNLGQQGNYLGGWLDGGKFYLDISSHIPEINRATAAAVRNKQLGIYDLTHGRTIDTDEAGWMIGAPGVVGKKRRGTAYPSQGRPAQGGQRAARSSRSASSDTCPACGRGIRSYDLSGVTDHKGQKWCAGCLPDGIKKQMDSQKKSNILDAVSTPIIPDDDEDFATDAWPSDHHPDTGNKLKATPADWHHRDKNQRWTAGR